MQRMKILARMYGSIFWFESSQFSAMLSTFLFHSAHVFVKLDDIGVFDNNILYACIIIKK